MSTDMRMGSDDVHVCQLSIAHGDLACSTRASYVACIPKGKDRLHAHFNFHCRCSVVALSVVLCITLGSMAVYKPGLQSVTAR